MVIMLIISTELELKESTDKARSDLYLDLYQEVDSQDCLKTNLSDKRDAFNFPRVNSLLICSNFPTEPSSLS